MMDTDTADGFLATEGPTFTQFLKYMSTANLIPLQNTFPTYWETFCCIQIVFNLWGYGQSKLRNNAMGTESYHKTGNQDVPIFSWFVFLGDEKVGQKKTSVIVLP